MRPRAANPSLLDRVWETYHMIDAGNAVILFFGIAILMWVGQRAVEGRGDRWRLGWRVGFLGFSAYVLGRFLLVDSFTEDVLFLAGFRGLLAGGFCTAVTWVGVSLAGFVWDHTLGAIIKRIRQRLRARVERKWARLREEQSRAERASRERREEQERRREREAERTAVASEQGKRRQKKLRDEARFQVECFHAANEAKLKKTIPADRLKEMLDRHLGADCPEDQIGARAGRLMTILVECAGGGQQGKSRFSSFVEIETWFNEQLADLAQTSLADRDKRRITAELKVKFSEKVDQMLDEI